MSVTMGVWEPAEAAIKTKILIVAVSITSKEKSERNIVFEFKRPKHPMTIRTTIGMRRSFSGVNSIDEYMYNKSSFSD